MTCGDPGDRRDSVGTAAGPGDRGGGEPGAGPGLDRDASGEAHRRARLRRALAWAFLILALGFVGWLLVGQGGRWAELRGDLAAYGWRLRPGWLALALLVATADLFLMGAVWLGLFRAGGGRLGTGEGLRAWLATNLGRYIPGKIWQVTGLTAWIRGRGSSGAAALGALLAFQVLTLGTGAAVAIPLLAAGGGGLAGVPGLPALAAALALALLAHPSVLQRVSRLAARLLREAGEPPRLGAGAISAAAGGMVAAWVVYGAGFWCLVRGLGGEAIPPVLLTGAFAAAYVAGYLAFVVPGGLGVREGALAGLLTLAGGAPLAVSAAVAVAARVWVTASEILAVALIMLGGVRSRCGPAEAERERGAP